MGVVLVTIGLQPLRGHRGQVPTGLLERRTCSRSVVNAVVVQAMPSPEMPQQACAIPTADAGQGPAVGAEGQAVDSTPMAVQRVAEVARGRIPQANDPVSNTTGQDPAVGAEGQAVDTTPMGGQRVAELACGRIPQANDPADIAAGQGLAVRIKDHAGDLRLAFQDVLDGTCGCIPQANIPVGITDGQGLAIGTEGDAVAPVRLVVQRVAEFTRGHIPQIHGSRVAVASDQGLAVGTEGDAFERIRRMTSSVWWSLPVATSHR